MFSTLNILVVIISVILISLLSFYFIAIFKVALSWSDSCSHSKVSIVSKVICVRQELKSSQIKNHAHMRIAARYYATFDIGNGEQKEFILMPRHYALLEKGDCGTLTYRGECFISFVKESRRYDKDLDEDDKAFDDADYDDEYNAIEDTMIDKYGDKYDERYYK